MDEKEKIEHELKIAIENLKKEIIEKQNILNDLINKYQELNGIEVEDYPEE